MRLLHRQGQVGSEPRLHDVAHRASCPGGIHFDDGQRILYYNAGVDPDARDLSPGVVMVARYIEQAIETGRRELDFLRGDEPYKYEWGAVDQPLQRILVDRTDA